MALALLGLAALASRSASAARPTEGLGLWTYDPDDVIESWEDPSGRVRVHYAVAGPSATLLDDLDDDGTPDYVAAVATKALLALDRWAELDLRPPVPEAEFGLEALGGSPALDIYLIDFFGNADGVFEADQCGGTPPRCVGWIGVENDFEGYGYPTLDRALTTVVPHESFHAVQAAYAHAQPAWFSEGTATWAERVFDVDAPGFLARCDDYLALSERPLDQPPPGPVQAFAYGTALWWWYLTERHGLALMNALLEASDGAPADLLGVIRAEILEPRGDDWDALWLSFVQANLASGARSGATLGHVFADELAGIVARAEGPSIDDSIQVFPVAARYYRIDHAGGPLRVAIAADDPQLRLSLHPVEAGASDGPVGEAIPAWNAVDSPNWIADDLPAGGLWLAVARAEPTRGSKATICAGAPDLVSRCLGEEPGDGDGDDDDDDDGDDDDDPSGDSSEDGDSTSEDTTGDDAAAAADGGCMIVGDDRRPGSWLCFLAPLLLGQLRRAQRGGGVGVGAVVDDEHHQHH